MAGIVLALVFLDELLAIATVALWGARTSGVVLAVGAALAVVIVWYVFASPKARYGGPVVRPIVKALVFTAASVGLWAVGLPGWGLALLLFSLVVNGLAQLPSVRALVPDAQN